MGRKRLKDGGSDWQPPGRLWLNNTTTAFCTASQDHQLIDPKACDHGQSFKSKYNNRSICRSNHNYLDNDDKLSHKYFKIVCEKIKKYIPTTTTTTSTIWTNEQNLNPNKQSLPRLNVHRNSKVVPLNCVKFPYLVWHHDGSKTTRIFDNATDEHFGSGSCLPSESQAHIMSTELSSLPHNHLNHDRHEPATNDVTSNQRTLSSYDFKDWLPVNNQHPSDQSKQITETKQNELNGRQTKPNDEILQTTETSPSLVDGSIGTGLVKHQEELASAGSVSSSSHGFAEPTGLSRTSQPITAMASNLSPDHMQVAASKKKKKMKMMKKKKKMEKKHKEWKKGKKHKKKKYESKKKKGGSSKKKKGKKEKKKWGMEKKGHKKKGNFKKKKWGSKKKMKKGHKKGKKGHKMLKDKGHKKKGFKKVYHKEEWGKKKKWHDIKREKKWNTKAKKWKKKWHQEKGKKYKGKHMKKYHKKNKHGKKYKKEKKSKWKKHKGEKFKKGHKKKKEEYSKKKEGGKKKKMKKMKKEMKKKKKG